MLRSTLRTATCAAVMAAGLSANHAEADAVQAIERYCQTSWRQAGIPQQEWLDCTQQTFVELLDRVSRARLVQAIDESESAERRELHRSIWCVAQRWRRSLRSRPYNSDGWVDQTSDADAPGAEDQLAAREEIEAVLDRLSDTQRQVLELWSQGLPINDVAERLQISSARASDLKYKALRKLRDAFAEREAA